MASCFPRGSPDRAAESRGRARISSMAPADDADAAHPKELGIADALTLARELLKDQRLEAAHELYRRILAVAPDHPDALNFRGVVAFQLGHTEEAEASLRRAIELV